MLLIRCFPLICIAAWLCLARNAVAQDGSAVLEKLKRYDSIYEAGFTVSGTLKSQDTKFPLQLVEVKRNWRLTFERGRCGYLMEVTEYEKPKFKDPQGSRGSLDESGWMVLSIRTKQWGYWGKDVSGNHYEDTVIKVSPANEVVEFSKMHNSSLFGPKDDGPNVRKWAVLWSLGRYFSKYIDEINHVKESTNGLITVSALGRKGDRQPGRWELEIEPAAAWMVRKARFYSEADPETIHGEMRNSGTEWSGSYCIPKKARFIYWGSIDGGMTLTKGLKKKAEEFTFRPTVESFDEKLYDGAQQAVTKDRPPNLTIHDYRMSPPLVFQPDEIAKILPLSDINLVKVNGANTDKKRMRLTSPTSAVEASTSSSVQMPVHASPIAERPGPLLPRKWAFIALSLAVALAGAAIVLLRKSREN